MKLVEGTHYRRRLDQPSPHPHLSKEFVDCLLCAAPSDSEDDQVRRRMTRKNTRKGIRLDRLTRHFNLQHRSETSNEGRTLLHYPSFGRATAKPKTVVAAHPRSHDSEVEPMESAEPPNEVDKHEQQPQQEQQQEQSLTTILSPSPTAEICSDVGQPYWRAFTVQIDTVVKANCTAQVIPSSQTIAEEVIGQHVQKDMDVKGSGVSRERWHDHRNVPDMVRERVAFVLNRQAKATIGQLCVEGGGPIDEVCLKVHFHVCEEWTRLIRE
jgi:hypothetical protein